MEFLRDAVTESANNTFTQSEIPTPVSRSEKLAMLVWQIEFFHDQLEAVDGQTVSLRVQLFSESQTALLSFEDPDMVAEVHEAVGQVAQGSLSEYLVVASLAGPALKTYQPPFLYTKASMFLGIASVQATGVRSGAIRIGYTLERVPDAIFIAALVE